MKKIITVLAIVTSICSFGQDKPEVEKKRSYTNVDFHETYQPKNYKKWKKRPKNVILLIGDGTGLAQLYSAYTANKGRLNLFNLTNVGFSITTSANRYITDSAAGATAMASGIKTNNSAVGVDPNNKPVTLITDELRAKNFKIAVISNGDITDATPASFYAHQPSRKMMDEIALDFMASKTDVLIGGGTSHFTKRTDKRNLLQELNKLGYGVTVNFTVIDSLRKDKFVVLDDKAVVSKMNGRTDFLQHSLRKTLQTFSKSKQPFFIMEEAAQIDIGGHNNNIEYVVTEALDFDKTIGDAIRFADSNRETLVIITADHETGGLSLIDGDISKGYVEASFGTDHHTSVAVPVFAYGPGADKFRGVYQNTEIYHKLKILLGL